MFLLPTAIERLNDNDKGDANDDTDEGSEGLFHTLLYRSSLTLLLTSALWLLLDWSDHKLIVFDSGHSLLRWLTLWLLSGHAIGDLIVDWCWHEGTHLWLPTERFGLLEVEWLWWCLLWSSESLARAIV